MHYNLGEGCGTRPRLIKFAIMRNASGTPAGSWGKQALLVDTSCPLPYYMRTIPPCWGGSPIS